jgi:WD40 repeat protein
MYASNSSETDSDEQPMEDLEDEMTMYPDPGFDEGGEDELIDADHFVDEDVAEEVGEDFDTHYAPEEPADDIEFVQDEEFTDDIEVEIDVDDELLQFDRANETDITAEDVSAGKDPQGIPWAQLRIKRDDYRKTRKKQYQNYENVDIPDRDERLKKDLTPVRKDGNYYRFRYNARSIRSSVCHFQLRNLVWATSKQDVYYTNGSCIYHYCPITVQTHVVLDLSGQAVPRPSSFLSPRLPAHGRYRRVQISTTLVKHGYLIAGGFHGEVVAMDMNTGQLLFDNPITMDDNAITNAFDLKCHSQTGDMQLVCSNNDCIIRVFHLPTFKYLQRFHFPFCINQTVLSPDDKLMCVVGDHSDGLLIDAVSGQTISTLRGHFDYSFAAAWHPSGRYVATGNQDKTVRVWDVRYPSQSYAVLDGELGAVRSMRFTSDGRYMAVAECADYVHIYDTTTDYHCCQQIDLFGEITGISFSPDDSFLFIANSDPTYGSMMEYEMCTNPLYDII